MKHGALNEIGNASAGDLDALIQDPSARYISTEVDKPPCCCALLALCVEQQVIKSVVYLVCDDLEKNYLPKTIER